MARAGITENLAAFSHIILSVCVCVSRRADRADKSCACFAAMWYVALSLGFFGLLRGATVSRMLRRDKPNCPIRSNGITNCEDGQFVKNSQIH